MTTPIYERIKSVLWPHFAVPLAVIVLLDYAAILATITQIGCAAYIVVHGLCFGVGFFAGTMTYLGYEHNFLDGILKLRIARVIPAIVQGHAAARWLLTEREG